MTYLGVIYTRYDSGKVYSTNLPGSTTSDRLLYDFSLKLNDSIIFDTLSLYVYGKYKVDSVSTISCLNGQSRKFMKLHTSGSALRKNLYWIDGIGDIKYGVMYSQPGWEGAHENFICHHDSTGLVYGVSDSLYDCDSMKFHSPKIFSIKLSVTNVSCAYSKDGCIKVTPSFGCPPYSYHWMTGVDNISSNPDQVCNLWAITYTITVTDCKGNTLVGSVSITQPPQLVVATSTTSATNGNSGGSASANGIGGTPGYFYSWNPPVANTQTITGLTCGTYVVTVTDANNCSASSTAVVTCVTGISELNSDPEFKLYPNPASNNITIETITNKPYTAQIINLLGETIYSTEQALNKINIDVGILPKGIYIVRILDIENNALSRQRVVIQ